MTPRGLTARQRRAIFFDGLKAGAVGAIFILIVEGFFSVRIEREGYAMIVMLTTALGCYAGLGALEAAGRNEK